MVRTSMSQCICGYVLTIPSTARIKALADIRPLAIDDVDSILRYNTRPEAATVEVS